MSVTPPPAPQTIEATGLETSFLVNQMLKNIYRLGLERASEISESMRLGLPIVEHLIAHCRENRLLQTLGSIGASVTAQLRYELTDAGKAWALDALTQSEYVGAAPVPLEQFVQQVRRQPIRNEVITRQRLNEVLQDLTLSQEIADAVGPAANSAASMLLYGPPGNGKSSIATAICRAFTDVVFIPEAIVVDQQVITVFDTTVHTPVKVTGGDSGLRLQRGYDRRFKVCKRPIVITGGELTIDMLDLAFNPSSRVYEAPAQLKATGGIFVIDDFGRQREQPQALINRWIIPLEAGVDYLMLQSGRKFEAPFDTLVIFSTNIPPRQLVDEAALRRLRHKIEVPRPDRESFIRIFVETARKRRIPIDENIMRFILFDLYEKEKRDYAGFHPGFLMDQIASICAYEQAPLELRPEYLRRAWRNLFTTA